MILAGATNLQARPFSAASRRATGRQPQRVRMHAAASQDLLIVGPGVLGTYLGKQWLEANPGCSVVGQTNTANNHERLAQVGLKPVTKDTADPGQKFSYIAFCAPPSGSEDYAGEVKAALSKWDGTGSFVFTSSTRTLQKPPGAVADENTPLAALGADAGLDKILLTEKAVLEGQGNVVRLVGLYHRMRGAHTFFLKMGSVPRDPNHVVNLIHYEDAAHIVHSVLKGQGSADGAYRGRQFIGCDNQPITFKDMMDACISSGVFSGSVEFTGASSPVSSYSTVNNNKSRAELQWQPVYESFSKFMMDGGKDWYFTSGVF